jgi:PST family polysaccharide transporter
VARGLAILIRLVVLSEVARFLTPAQLGVYGVLLSMLDIARVVTNFGLDTAAIRQMAIHLPAARELLRTVLRIKTVLATAGLVVLSLIGWLHPPDGAAGWLPVALGLALFPITWSSSLMARFQVSHAMHRTIPVQAAAGAFYLLGIELAAHAGAGLAGFILLAIVTEALTWAGTVLVARRSWPSNGPISAPITPWAFVQDAFPLGLLDVMVIAYNRLGVFILNAQGEQARAAVGHLYAAVRVNEVTTAVAGAIAISALPVFARLAHEKKERQITRTFARYSLLGGTFSISVFLCFFFFGHELLLRFRPAYEPAAAPLVIFSAAGIAMFQNNLSMSVITAFGRFRTASGCALLNLVIYSTCGFILIPRHGALGAAWSTLITEGVNMLVQLTIVGTLLRRSAVREGSISIA